MAIETPSVVTYGNHFSVRGAETALNCFNTGVCPPFGGSPLDDCSVVWPLYRDYLYLTLFLPFNNNLNKLFKFILSCQNCFSEGKKQDFQHRGSYSQERCQGPTWREQLRSRDSLSSSFSTDWQMGQPSPCRATLFTSRKLQQPITEEA